MCHGTHNVSAYSAAQAPASAIWRPTRLLRCLPDAAGLAQAAFERLCHSVRLCPVMHVTRPIYAAPHLVKAGDTQLCYNEWVGAGQVSSVAPQDVGVVEPGHDGQLLTGVRGVRGGVGVVRAYGCVFDSGDMGPPHQVDLGVAL